MICSVITDYLHDSTCDKSGTIVKKKKMIQYGYISLGNWAIFTRALTPFLFCRVNGP